VEEKRSLFRRFKDWLSNLDMSEPGILSDQNKDIERITSFPVLDGFKVSLQRNLSKGKDLTYESNWTYGGSQGDNCTFNVVTEYEKMGLAILSQVGTDGGFGKLMYSGIKSKGVMSAQVGQISMLSAEFEKRGVDWGSEVKFQHVVQPMGEQTIATISYNQTISPKLTLGVDLTHLRSGGGGVTYAAKYTRSTTSYATLKLLSNFIPIVGYHYRGKSGELAAMSTIQQNQEGGFDPLVNVGIELKSAGTTFSTRIGTDFKVGVFYEELSNMLPLRVHSSFEVDLAQQKTSYGIGFQFSLS